MIASLERRSDSLNNHPIKLRFTQAVNLTANHFGHILLLYTTYNNPAYHINNSTCRRPFLFHKMKGGDDTNHHYLVYHILALTTQDIKKGGRK